MLLLPPPNVGPRDLFARLAQWPYATATVECDLDIPGWERPIAKPIAGIDWIRIASLADPSEVIAASLIDESGDKVFRSAQHVRRILLASEIGQLFLATRVQLDIISPHYSRIDATRWMATLVKGARACSSVASEMSQCVRVVFGPGGGVYRERHPERYYGASRRELLDGHLMAFRAACDYVEESQ